MGSHQLLNAEEERALTRDAQHLTRLEALAAPEVERLGRKLLLHEWAALAGELDVDAFKARVQVCPASLRVQVQCLSNSLAHLEGVRFSAFVERCILRRFKVQSRAQQLRSGLALLGCTTGMACS